MPTCGLPVGEGAMRTRIMKPIISLLSFGHLNGILKSKMTLTEAAQLTKRWAVVFLILVVSYLGSRAVWTYLRETVFPPKLPPPEVAFGKLPALEIPQLPFKEGTSPEYIVDTKTGRLPTDLPDRAKVYKIILPSPTQLAGERAKNLATELGFSAEPKKLSSSDYSWEKAEEGKTLEINIITGRLSLKTDLKKLRLLQKGSPPSKAAAIEQASRFLSKLGLLNEDYSLGRKEATYLQIEGVSLAKTENLAEAQLVRIDFFRGVEDQPITTPKPHEGLISVTLGKDKVPFVSYSFWPLNPLQSTTYPIKTPEQVWEEVAAGQAKMVSLAPQGGDPFASYEPRAPETIFVRQISLGFFDSEKLQDYLQPVYILEGLGLTKDKQQLEYIAYIPAIAYDWVAEE